MPNDKKSWSIEGRPFSLFGLHWSNSNIPAILWHYLPDNGRKHNVYVYTHKIYTWELGLLVYKENDLLDILKFFSGMEFDSLSSISTVKWLFHQSAWVHRCTYFCWPRFSVFRPREDNGANKSGGGMNSKIKKKQNKNKKTIPDILANSTRAFKEVYVVRMVSLEFLAGNYCNSFRGNNI